MTLAVGVDLGGTNIRAALIDVEGGRETGDVKAPVQNKNPEAVADLVAKLVAEVDPDKKRVGVGVGFAGMLRGWTGVVVNSPNFGWREVPLRALLRDRIGERTELYNDLNAIAFGEAKYGGAKNIADVLCVYVGTGVGGGLVLDGKLYIGSTHLAGEIGHTKVVPNGRLCGCGQRGCLEAYVSGVHLQARAQEELHAGKQSSVIALAKSIDNVHAGFLDQAASAGDAYASELWNEASGLLGLVLANAVTLINPQRLVMGGGVWQGAPELKRRTLDVMRSLANKPSIDSGFSVSDTLLGDSAGRLGAAALVSGVFS